MLVNKTIQTRSSAHSYANMGTAENEGDAWILQKRNNVHYQSSKTAIAMKPDGGHMCPELLSAVSTRQVQKTENVNTNEFLLVMKDYAVLNLEWYLK